MGNPGYILTHSLVASIVTETVAKDLSDHVQPIHLEVFFLWEGWGDGVG